MCDAEYKVEFNLTKCLVLQSKTDEIILIGCRNDNIYVISLPCATKLLVKWYMSKEDKA